MLDVRRMQVLRAVVTSGSMTEAATNLGYTPSAVSQQVAALEREAGIALLERVGRGVRPTAAGRLLTEHAAVISRNVAEAESALADLRAGRTGRLVVRYFATAGVALMPPALARLRREHPGVHVDLSLIDPDDPLPAVERGEADLAVVVGRRNSPRDGVQLVPLHDDPYRAVLPKGHPLAAKRVLDLADLADESWVGTEWRAGLCLEIMLDACASAGFSPNFAVESDDYATAQGFIAAGMGVSLIPRLGLGNRHPGVVVRKVRRPEPIRSIYAAVRETSSTQPALRTLIDALRAAAPE
ncbi:MULTISPECIES: LysR family transcriptional regulator [Actinoalloteichus]|uniref:Transcriptional regulator n=1 Tax=Actinoalloteichus fjordicus TaxID=1612552 RepID=A0AAC9PRH6_9PSEU|nr:MULTISPECIES: LysR family transcriptional regulator [Actinoalloteichus]APU14359.1 transcriptional regulator [Actinoalloteichus fjordicus]APU20328.1 transcriptional regulator [Actinoalloteichus sp. GBA129-24]